MTNEIANNPSPEKLTAEAQAMFDALVGARKALVKALPLLPPDAEAVYCGEWLVEINEVLGRLCGWSDGSPRAPGFFKVTRDSAGQLHSFNDQPADIHGNGSKFWYSHGEYHRDNDLPALVHGNGSQYWYQNGKPHRDHGRPAIVLYDGTKQYWVGGKQVAAPEVDAL